LHVIVPLQPEYDYKTVRSFTQSIAQELARRYPDGINAERDPRKRPAGTVHVDWGQMGRGMTIVPPYTARACAHAPVSMPVEWDEVERYARSRSKKAPMETFAQYTIANVVDYLKRNGDPWAAIWSGRRQERLTCAHTRLPRAE
jgi:bifunctional non-homologous end joining protein LigD